MCLSSWFVTKGTKLKNLIILLLFFMGMESNAIAQSVPKTAPNVVSNATTLKFSLIKKQNEQLKESIQELKIRNESLKGFQNSLLSTVYWSLGFLGSITALLVGFGWWSNFKVHEKDKDSLKNEIISLTSEFESNWKSMVSEFRRKDNLLLEKRIQETKKIIDKQTDELKSQIANVGNMVKKLQDDRGELNSKFEEHLDNFKKQNHKNMYELRYVEKEIWEIKGYYGNVLLTQAQGIESVLNFDEAEAKRLLESMDKTLDDITDEDYQCSDGVRKRVIETIDHVKNQEVLVNKILSKFKKIKIRPE
jgi:hypothetical protein